MENNPRFSEIDSPESLPVDTNVSEIVEKSFCESKTLFSMHYVSIRRTPSKNFEMSMVPIE
jgi:hypothetical protein